MAFAPPAYPLLTTKQFLEFSFSDRKAELDRGVIRVLDGVTVRHADIQGNLLAAMHGMLRGTSYQPYMSSMPIRTGERSVRRADLVIVHGKQGPEHDDDDAFDDPIVIFEIVHVGPPRTDLAIKLDEYRALASADTIVVVDAVSERLRVIQRAGQDSWTDQAYTVPIDLRFPSPGVVLPHADVFTRD